MEDSMTGFMARLRTVAVPASVVLLLAAGAAGPAAGQAPPATPAPAAPQTPPAPQPPATPPPAPQAPPPATQQEPPSDNVQRPDSLQPGDAFGEQVTLPELTIIYTAGSGQWDHAFETIVEAFKT